MAKTESTAVNELIGLVQSGNSNPGDPGGELFDEPKSQKVQPPRMTATVPPMRGAGEVAPLPPKRAPASTATHQQIRTRTASPTRGTTIPTLARPSSPPPVPSRTTSSQRVVTIPPPVPSRTKTPSQQIAAPPKLDDSEGDDMDWDIATQA